MYIHESGAPAGDTILFLHAVGQSGRMWDLHIEELSAQGFYCVALDLPGHGRSNTEPWTDLDDVTRKIAGLAARTDGGKVHVVGLSLGGSIAINLLNDHPDLVESAVTDGAAAIRLRFHRLLLAGVSLVSPFMRTGPVLRLIGGVLGVGERGRPKFEQDMKAVSSKAFRRSLAQANTMATPENMRRVTTRVLLVAGEKETVEMREWQQRLCNILGKGEAYVVPGQGHGGFLARSPELHVRMVRAWIEGTSLPDNLVRNTAGHNRGRVPDVNGSVPRVGTPAR